MTEAIITQIKNQKITLPKGWKGSSVLLRVTGDTATITKVKKSKSIFSAEEVNSLRNLGKVVSKKVLKKALAGK